MERLAALLDVARELVDRNDFDVHGAIELLDTLPIFDFDVPVQGAILHAQMVADAARDRSSAHASLARFALFRVVRLLEQRVALTTAIP